MFCVLQSTDELVARSLDTLHFSAVAKNVNFSLLQDFLKVLFYDITSHFSQIYFK